MHRDTSHRNILGLWEATKHSDEHLTRCGALNFFIYIPFSLRVGTISKLGPVPGQDVTVDLGPCKFFRVDLTKHCEVSPNTIDGTVDSYKAVRVLWIRSYAIHGARHLMSAYLAV